MSYELQDLSGKVVVVTGATSGIGRETARGMVAQGAKVVLNARKENDLKALCAELTDKSATYVAGDCSDPEVSRRIAAAAIEKAKAKNKDVSRFLDEEGKVKEADKANNNARWQEGKFETSTGEVLTREQAKEKFGFETSEEIPPEIKNP